MTPLVAMKFYVHGVNGLAVEADPLTWAQHVTYLRREEDFATMRPTTYILDGHTPVPEPDLERYKLGYAR